MRAKHIPTPGGWLDGLGKRLVWYFPAPQVRDILEDFGDQWATGRERGRAAGEILEALGTPAEAAAQILDQEPAARLSRLRQSALWGALLAVCLAFLWVSVLSLGGGLLLPLCSLCSCLFLPAASSALFLLLRGPARVTLEERFPPQRRASPLPGLLIPFGVTALFEAVELTLIAAPRLSPEYVGMLNTYFILTVAAALGLLALWLVYRTAAVSVGYFPGIPHAVGALGTTFFSYAQCHSLSIADSHAAFAGQLLLCLLPYCAGLATALAFQRWTDRRRPLPSLLRERPSTRQGWLHRLGVCLLGWFSAEQAADILSDYDEQLQVGLERGRTEEALIADFGQPETVVRDLLAEDPRARLRRRRTLPWMVMLAAAAWLLLGLLRAFARGAVGWLRWVYFTGNAHWVGAAALLLGTAALSVLLRVRQRAALESRFSPEKRPKVWSLLPPLLLTALVGGPSIWTVCRVHALRADGVLLPVGQWIVLSIELSVLALMLELIWTLARCFSGSIRYLSAAVHAAGSMAGLLCLGIPLHAIDVTSPVPPQLLLPSLLPYAVGAVLAAVLWAVLERGGKEGAWTRS